MNYILMPSLKQRALIKVTTSLWDKINVDIDLDKDCFLPSKRVIKLDVWQQIEDRVLQKVKDIPLPKSLQQEVLNLVKPIGLQILNWMCLHYARLNLVNPPNEICWTSQGTIDKVKTAKLLVENVSLGLSERYIIACMYCLEDYIWVLWEQQKLVRNDNGFIRILNEHLFLFWNGSEREITRFADRDPSKNILYTCILRIATIFKEETAIKFFFLKLSDECRKELSFVTAQQVAKACQIDKASTFTEDYYSNVLCFLLSFMDERQQTEIFRTCSYGVLACLLHWPWQNFFMKTADCMWSFLSVKDYNQLLQDIVCSKVAADYKDYDYQNLFGEFWKRSPYTHKKYVIDQCCFDSKLLFNLFKTNDKDNITLIFKDADATEREKVILGNKNICVSLVHNGNWNLLQFFIERCISSRNMMIEFQKEFQEQLRPSCSKGKSRVEQDMWNRFFRLLDVIIQEFDEGREDGPVTKKLRVD